MEYLPILNYIVFILTTALSIYLFYRAVNGLLGGLVILLAWLLLQTILSLSGFYEVYHSHPPRLIFLLLPPVIFIVLLFITGWGKRFIERLNPGTLTLIHIVRIPVELVLYGLFLQKQVPQLMTFAGGNYDIVSGLTAPFIYYFGFVKNRISRELMLGWNFICLGLLFNIVYRAVLSAPTPFQQFAFDQPNIAILHFPYVWLPACIVPLVLFSHISVIRQQLKAMPKKKHV